MSRDKVGIDHENTRTDPKESDWNGRIRTKNKKTK